jgi:hypothetical protein
MSRTTGEFNLKSIEPPVPQRGEVVRFEVAGVGKLVLSGIVTNSPKQIGNTTHIEAVGHGEFIKMTADTFVDGTAGRLTLEWISEATTD